MRYNILNFGAQISDSLQTEKIQAAIDACFCDGGGEVIIPSGVFRTGGLRIRSNVIIHLLSGAILEGSEDPEDYYGYTNDIIEPISICENDYDCDESVYPFSRWNNAIIRAIDAENISIIGEPGSYIDGVNCFDESGEEGYRGPHSINFWNCKNIRLEGYTIRRSANWAHAIFNSSNIFVKNISVYGGHDGFDVRSCDDILIENCCFYTGDDCVAGFDNKNVTIKNCLMNTACNAIRFGGTDVLIESCKIWSPSNFGHRYKLSNENKKFGKEATKECNHYMSSAFCYYCDFRVDVRNTPGNILMKNCEIDNVNSVFVNQFGRDIWCSNREIESFSMENCKATNLGVPIAQHGDKNKSNMVLEFKNVEFSAANENKDNPFMYAKYFKRVTFENVMVNNYNIPTIIKEKQGKDGEFEFKNSTEIKIREME